MSYQPKDLERAKEFREQLRAELVYSVPPSFLDRDVAKIIAAVRRDTVEEVKTRLRGLEMWCSRDDDLIEQFCALLDEPKAEEPEPCCGEFGTGSGEHSHECGHSADYEPEEPGHG